MRYGRSVFSRRSRTPDGPRPAPPATSCDILRSCGVTFETLEGETPEPGDVPAESATPPEFIPA